MESSQYESLSMVLYMYLFFMFTVNNMFFVLLYNGLNTEIIRITADYNHIKDTLDLLANEYDTSDSETDSSDSGSDDSIENISNKNLPETKTDTSPVSSLFNWSYTYK
jgi:hypothetical protein